MSGQTPLPTRVSKACDRCRRNKSRVSLFRLRVTDPEGRSDGRVVRLISTMFAVFACERRVRDDWQIHASIDRYSEL